MGTLEQHAMRTVDSSAHILFPEPALQKIFLTVYLTDEPVSLKHVAETTGLSLASVSTKAKEMAHNGILEKHTKPGSRELFLKTDQSLAEVMATHTDQKLKAMRRQRDELTSIKQDATGDEHDRLERMLTDVDHVIEAHEKLKRALEGEP